jgi:hypothetical protein
MAASDSGHPSPADFRPLAEQKPPLEEEQLLEQVLKQTEESGEEPLDPAEIAAFREVADRWRGQPLALETVGTDLVRAALRGMLDHWGQPPDIWQPLIARVAAAIFEDPAARERLAKFWTRLSGDGG